MFEAECEQLDCEHHCMKDDDGNAVCTCPKEFKLRDDQKTCYGM